MTIRRAPLAVVAASALLLLVGCSAGSSADASATPDAATPSRTPEVSASAEAGQSKADACQIVLAAFTDFGTIANDLDMSDPEGAIEKFRGVANDLQADFEQITNAEIAPLAQDSSAQLNDYTAFLESMLADPTKASELGDRVTALQESIAAAGTACQS